ncbi:hypothetical protein H4CHR_04393 [Variovorax sp. PBS-H4]|uniref:DUF2829 domain-containing protein n=1 Tax=Variovorax sp. PBS-H4 TaxID=434008 RepID=UPI001318AB3B|nr:DUF2829 domain-containing protein [Variovorax sp. PBS-H4]VTU38317.1 hypothetical protein H4CHR_04393 [Variovorax sp. PBS-H4]
MSENKVIIPTVGRRVWYYPHPLSGASGFVCHNQNVPMDAGIVYVWSDRCVNLDVTDHAGNHHAFTSVDLWHGNGDRPNGAFCEWMPYQKGQASKPDDIKALVAAALAELLKPGPIEVVPRAKSDISYAPYERVQVEHTDKGWRIAGLTFGAAIRHLKDGDRVARKGWNGKGMFVYYVPAASYPAQTGAAKAHFGDGAMVPYNAYLALKGVDGSISTWVPSINDVLAEDWVVL